MDHSTDIGRQAQDHAADLGAQAKSMIEEEAVGHADQAKAATAQKISQAANATEAAAGQFDPASPQAEAMQQVADQIESVAARLRHADVRDIAEEATSLARRHPLLFIGGAAIAGFAAARFLKARDPHRSTASSLHGDDPWADPTIVHRPDMAHNRGSQTHG